MQREIFETVLAELNSVTGLHVGLSPEYSPEKQAYNGTGLGYMLCREGEDRRRRLILILDQFSLNYRDAAAQVVSEVLSFWGDGNADINKTVVISY